MVGEQKALLYNKKQRSCKSLICCEIYSSSLSQLTCHPYLPFAPHFGSAISWKINYTMKLAFRKITLPVKHDFRGMKSSLVEISLWSPISYRRYLCLRFDITKLRSNSYWASVPSIDNSRLVVDSISDAMSQDVAQLRRRPTKGLSPEKDKQKKVIMEIDRIPTYRGIPLRYISLVTLTIQNSALILIMHYSRIMPGYEQKRYFSSTAVLLNELLKLAISVVLHYRELRSRLGPQITVRQILQETFTSDALKLTVPAVLYTVRMIWCFW